MIKIALSALTISLVAQAVFAADPVKSVVPAVPGATTNSAGSTSNPAISPAVPLATPLLAAPAQPVVPATTREEAERDTAVKAGRHDPFAPFGSESSRFAKKGDKFKDLQKSLVPPPPGVSPFAPMPLPPGEGSLAISELPLPPARPSMASKLKLSAVFDNRAIFTIPDLSARRMNKWPPVIRLGLGEKFSSIRLVAVGVDSATLEEDGTRLVKELEPLK
jgi:hypothetical protein